jgi:hypothetical protein
LGAEASLSGDVTFTISIANADILPTDDSSPIRLASASFTLSGSLVPYAIGAMDGTTESLTEVTNDSIARAVWDELLSSHMGVGTTGLALATASSGGVDPGILAAAVWAYAARTLSESGNEAAAAALLEAAQVTPIHSDTRMMNGADIIGSGIESDLWRGNV